MKNDYRQKISVFLVGAIASLSLWSQSAIALNTEDANTLSNLLSNIGINVSSNPNALLADNSTIVLTTGQLSDEQVAVYRDKYNSDPMVLPLTTKLLGSSSANDDEGMSDQEVDRLFFAALSEASIVYLYINPQQFSRSDTDLSELLMPLLQDDFQNKLQDSRFAALPAEYIQQWAVSLGKSEPQHTGGYK